MIDLHAHVLPLIDDGSESLDLSLEMLREASGQGVTDMVLTPHLNKRYDLSVNKVKSAFEDFKVKAKDNGCAVNLYLGQELHQADEMLSLMQKGEALTINNGKYFLLEFSWHVPCDFVAVVKKYVDAGYTPIVVHFERFPYYSLEMVRAIKEAGALIQINAFSIFGCEYPQNGPNSLEILDNDLADFVASDIHHYKKLYLKEAYEFIVDRYGEKRAQNLFRNNALKILGLK